jgi:streptogramin lyase
MIRRFLKVLAMLAMLVAYTRSPLAIRAAALTPGNLLVSEEVFRGPGRIREFTPAGTLVQTWTLPTNGQPRDLAIDANGHIRVYNGTFNPTLTELNPATNAVVGEQSFTSWNTGNSTTYGGVAAFGEFVFVSDMQLTGETMPGGIIRFSPSGLGVRFGGELNNIGRNPVDLVAGQDGLLYSLTYIADVVEVYDPTSLELLRSIHLPMLLHNISVDSNGHIFGGTLNDGHIYHFDSDGALVGSYQTNMRGFLDSNIDRSGRLMFSTTANVILTNTSLSSISVINLDTVSASGALFTTWIERPLAIPEPPMRAIGAAGAAGIAGVAAWMRKRLAV